MHFQKILHKKLFIHNSLNKLSEKKISYLGQDAMTDST